MVVHSLHCLPHAKQKHFINLHCCNQKQFALDAGGNWVNVLAWEGGCAVVVLIASNNSLIRWYLEIRVVWHLADICCFFLSVFKCFKCNFF